MLADIIDFYRKLQRPTINIYFFTNFSLILKFKSQGIKVIQESKLDVSLKS